MLQNMKLQISSQYGLTHVGEKTPTCMMKSRLDYLLISNGSFTLGIRADYFPLHIKCV